MNEWMNEFISHKDIGYRLAKARGLYGLKMDSPAPDPGNEDDIALQIL